MVLKMCKLRYNYTKRYLFKEGNKKGRHATLITFFLWPCFSESLTSSKPTLYVCACVCVCAYAYVCLQKITFQPTDGACVPQVSAVALQGVHKQTTEYGSLKHPGRGSFYSPGHRWPGAQISPKSEQHSLIST